MAQPQKKKNPLKSPLTTPQELPSESRFALLSTIRTCLLSPGVVYGIGFVGVWLFCALTYGDVFQHISSENYVSCEAETMHYVLRRKAGWLFWICRYGLLLFKWPWIGAIFMAILFTLIAWNCDRLLPQQTNWRGIGFSISFTALGIMVGMGYDLFLRSEPSTFIIITLLFSLGAACCALVSPFLPTTRTRSYGKWPWGMGISAILYLGLTIYSLVGQENVRLSCRMQNQMEKADWEGMIQTARTAHRPTRSIAALHAIALVQTQQLLEGAWSIPYDFPELKLHNLAGSDESANYTAECNLHAGLSYPAYHTAMEQLVTLGPRLRTYKLLALSALINGESALAKRYLYIIGQMPFESAWVERHSLMLHQPALLEADPTLANILRLRPMERRFEQNYRKPAFLGYNVALKEGSNATLTTSVAACLYSKDLDNFLLRADALQRRMPLPIPCLQAIAIASIHREGLRQYFPACNDMVMGELQSFITEASDHLNRLTQSKNEAEKTSIRREMAAALRKKWLGSYYYYYYCGNMAQPRTQTQGHGVN